MASAMNRSRLYEVISTLTLGAVIGSARPGVGNAVRELGVGDFRQHEEARALERRLVGGGEVLPRREREVEAELGGDAHCLGRVVGARLAERIRERLDLASGPLLQPFATD